MSKENILTIFNLATPEEIEAGAPKTYEVPVTFDQSNFFG